MTPLRRRSRRAPLAALLVAIFAACGSPPPEGPPDVYLVVVDTLRADRLGCYGYERPTSPFLDELAREGTLFLDNTAQSSWTKPSMVSLLSGCYVTNYRDKPPEDVPSLAETFRHAGYRTFGVVANVLLSKKLGFDRGFDHYDAREHTEAEREALLEGGLPPNLCRPIGALRSELEELLEAEFERRDAGERRPIFAYIHPMEPHEPYQLHPRYADELPGEGSVRMVPEAWHRSAASALGRDPESDESRDEWARMNDHRARYDREVRATDDELRRFFQRLENRGRLDNAIVAVVSDHGEGLYDALSMLRDEVREEAPLIRVFKHDHGRTLNECLVRTPFLLWGRGVPAGRVIEEPVENVDLYPTLVSLCGMEPTGTTQGRDLVPVMRGDGEEWRRDLHSYTLFASSIRERATGLKLVLASAAGQELDAEPALYDTVADPQERVNLYDERPEDVERLKRKLVQWRDAFPMVGSDPNTKDPEQLRHLRALGYIEGD